LIDEKIHTGLLRFRLGLCAHKPQNARQCHSPEGPTLEYKEFLSLDTAEERKEFLRDLTAFANTRGGDIVCGIRENRDKGVPEKLSGIPLPNPDKWKQRIENIIRNGTDPKLYGTQIGDPIEVGDERFAVVIRIPRSFNAPHMVISGGDYRFYHRTNTGKDRLDVAGLRTLFGMADTIAARTHAFRAERLAKIQAKDTPVPLMAGPKCVLHLVPFDAFAPQTRHDLSLFADHPDILAKAGRWHPLSNIERSRWNFDGIVTYVPHHDENEPREWYTQCFRNGIIEAVNMEHNPISRYANENVIRVEYQERVAEAISKYFSIQRDMNVAPPVFALLTLLEMKGRILGRLDRDMSMTEAIYGAVKFQEESLVLPEVVFEDFGSDVPTQMKPIFEIVRNAASLP
jgi:hypothetical protein